MDVPREKVRNSGIKAAASKAARIAGDRPRAPRPRYSPKWEGALVTWNFVGMLTALRSLSSRALSSAPSGCSVCGPAVLRKMEAKNS